MKFIKLPNLIEHSFSNRELKTVDIKIFSGILSYFICMLGPDFNNINKNVNVYLVSMICRSNVCVSRYLEIY